MMTTVQYSTKLTPEQVKALKQISEKTHIPQAVLIRQGVDIIISELKDKSDFLDLVKKRVKEDKTLLNKLAKA
jgi:predicted DNA-binding protein